MKIHVIVIEDNLIKIMQGVYFHPESPIPKSAWESAVTTPAERPFSTNNAV